MTWPPSNTLPHQKSRPRVILDLYLTYFIIFAIDISILAKVNVHFRSHAFIDMHTRMEHYKIEPKLIQDRRGDINGIILLLLIFSVNLLGMKEKGFYWTVSLSGIHTLKGSSDQSHFIFEINVGKSRIRHWTTLKLNEFIFYGFWVNLEIQNSI